MLTLGILFSIFSANSFSNELLLHFIPSPAGVDWKTPSTLAGSVLLNQVAPYHGGERHEIGHVYEELTCGDQHLFLGMTTVGNSEERDLIFKEEYGLGILFHDFQGMMDDPVAAATDIAGMEATGRSNFVRFLISDSTCERLLEYLSEFQANHYDQIYAGLNGRPLDRQGSGCSAFAASFLELSGLQIPEFESGWMSTYVVPYKFIGGPITNARVNYLKILFSFESRWLANPDDGYLTNFWDPEKMHAWTAKLYRDLEQNQPRDFPWSAKPVMIDHSVGIEFDATNIPTPTGPIFHDPVATQQ